MDEVFGLVLGLNLAEVLREGEGAVSLSDTVELEGWFFRA